MSTFDNTFVSVIELIVEPLNALFSLSWLFLGLISPPSPLRPISVLSGYLRFLVGFLH